MTLTTLELETSSLVDVNTGDDKTAGVTLEVTTELIEVVLNDVVCRTHGSSGPWWLVVTVTVGDETTAAGVLTGALTGADVWTVFLWLLDEGEDWTGIRVWKYKFYILKKFWTYKNGRPREFSWGFRGGLKITQKHLKRKLKPLTDHQKHKFWKDRLLQLALELDSRFSPIHTFTPSNINLVRNGQHEGQPNTRTLTMSTPTNIKHVCQTTFPVCMQCFRHKWC